MSVDEMPVTRTSGPKIGHVNVSDKKKLKKKKILDKCSADQSLASLAHQVLSKDSLLHFFGKKQKSPLCLSIHDSIELADSPNLQNE